MQQSEWLFSASPEILERLIQLLESDAEDTVNLAFHLLQWQKIPVEIQEILISSDFKIKKCLEYGFLEPLLHPTLQNLSFDQLSDTQIENIFKLPQLKKLSISNSVMREIPSTFHQLIDLQELMLEKNAIEIIPESIGELQKLKILDLNSNFLKILPSSFAQLQSLTELYLYNNQFEEVPEVLASLPKLKSLVLAVNPIKTLPNWISNLPAIKEIQLYCCMLSKKEKDYWRTNFPQIHWIF